MNEVQQQTERPTPSDAQPAESRREKPSGESSFQEICNYSIAELSSTLSAYAARPENSGLEIIPELSTAILVGGFLKQEQYIGFDQRLTRSQIEKGLSHYMDMSPEAMAETRQELSILYSLGLVKDKQGNDTAKKGQFKVTDPAHGPEDPDLRAVLVELKELQGRLREHATFVSKQAAAAHAAESFQAAEEAAPALPPPPPEPAASSADQTRAHRRLREDVIGGCTHALQVLSPVKDLASHGARVVVAHSLIRYVGSGEAGIAPEILASTPFVSSRQLMEAECTRNINAVCFLPGAKVSQREREVFMRTARRDWLKEHAEPIARSGPVQLRLYEGALTNLRRQIPRGISGGVIDKVQGEEALELIDQCLACLPRKINLGVSGAEESAQAIQKLSADDSKLHRLVELMTAWTVEAASSLVNSPAVSEATASAPLERPESTPPTATTPSVPEDKPVKRYRLNTLSEVQTAIARLETFTSFRESDIENVTAISLLAAARHHKIGDDIQSNPIAVRLFDELQAFVAVELPKHQKAEDAKALKHFKSRMGAYDSYVASKPPTDLTTRPMSELRAEVVDKWFDPRWHKIANGAEARLDSVFNSVSNCLARLKTMQTSFGLAPAIVEQIEDAINAWHTDEQTVFAAERVGKLLPPALQSITPSMIEFLRSSLRQAAEALENPIASR